MHPGDPARRIPAMTSSTLFRRMAAYGLITFAVFLVAGALVDPAVDETSTQTYAAGLASGDAADRYQVSAWLLHISYLALLPAVAGLIGLVRPGRLRTIGGVLGVVGAGSLPGMLVTDYYDIAIATNLPADQAARVMDDAQGLTGAALMGFPSVLALMAGLILLFVAAWRSELVPGWATIAVPVGLVVPFMVGGMLTLAAGGAVMLAIFAVIARRLLRGIAQAAALGTPATATATA
jgi:hypothetical protein